MAARLRPRHQEDVRSKIKVSNIIDRLEKHVDGLIELSPTQVTSARILLDKSLASLVATEHTGDLSVTVQLVKFTDADNSTA